MKCKIDGCERDAMYKAQCVCQKHYFRIMRNGHPNLLLNTEKEKGIRNRKEFYITPNGYKRIYAKGHPLEINGWIFEHRFVMYKKYGETLPKCEICGKETNWKTCHIDHKDNDRLNNAIDNLRPVCRGCNTGRTERAGIKKYSYGGLTLSLTEWAKQEGVTVGRHRLVERLENGMDMHDALYSKNITHPKRLAREIERAQEN